jgi:hypothetical protein
MAEMEKYKHELLEWKQRVEEAYARLELAVQRNNSALPVIPPRPALPSFCASNQTTLYILAGCTVQNHKVYIAGKFARELTEKEKGQLDEFARQMLAQQQHTADQPTAAMGVSKEGGHFCTNKSQIFRPMPLSTSRQRQLHFRQSQQLFRQ